MEQNDKHFGDLNWLTTDERRVYARRKRMGQGDKYLADIWEKRIRDKITRVESAANLIGTLEADEELENLIDANCFCPECVFEALEEAQSALCTIHKMLVNMMRTRSENSATGNYMPMNWQEGYNG